MAWQPVRVFNATMAAAATLTAEVDLKLHYSSVNLLLPTFASASDWFVQATETTGGTYRRIASVVVGTSSVQVNDYKILSSVSNRMIEMPVGYRYIKIEASTANSSQIGLKIICGG